MTDLDLPTSSPFNDVKESRRRQMESESKASNAMLWGGGSVMRKRLGLGIPSWTTNETEIEALQLNRLTHPR